MVLAVKCRDCRTDNDAPHYKKNRIDYAIQYGDNFQLTCKACNKTEEYHVDDICAKDYSFVEIIKNRMKILLVTSVLSFVLGFILVSFFGGIIISLFSTCITMLFAKGNHAASNLTFNKHKLKGRVSGIGLNK